MPSNVVKILSPATNSFPIVFPGVWLSIDLNHVPSCQTSRHGKLRSYNHVLTPWVFGCIYELLLPDHAPALVERLLQSHVKPCREIIDARRLVGLLHKTFSLESPHIVKY